MELITLLVIVQAKMQIEVFGDQKTLSLILISNPLRKFQKVSCEKVTKNWVLDPYYYVQKFSASNFFGWFFAFFPKNGSNSASNFAFYNTHLSKKKMYCFY